MKNRYRSYFYGNIFKGEISAILFVIIRTSQANKKWKLIKTNKIF